MEFNNLLYDSTNSNCKCILADSQGKIYAFVQVLDIGMPESLLIKRYWGVYEHNDPEASIKNILMYGGKWPNLPT
ncbi:hypothetical protein [Xenorhabdus bovienii]|uniref:hypothetical protein n=1 Tax=Xenorhabdus bovienii TaxID=40576 RepID=UPI003DA4FBE1